MFWETYLKNAHKTELILMRKPCHKVYSIVALASTLVYFINLNLLHKSFICWIIKLVKKITTDTYRRREPKGRFTQKAFFLQLKTRDASPGNEKSAKSV